MESAAWTRTEDSLVSFDLLAVELKKMTGDFVARGGSLKGGLVLYREAVLRVGLADALVGCFRDRRNPELIVHMLSARLHRTAH